MHAELEEAFGAFISSLGLGSHAMVLLGDLRFDTAARVASRCAREAELRLLVGPGDGPLPAGAFALPSFDIDTYREVLDRLRTDAGREGLEGVFILTDSGAYIRRMGAQAEAAIEYALGAHLPPDVILVCCYDREAEGALDEAQFQLAGVAHGTVYYAGSASHGPERLDAAPPR